MHVLSTGTLRDALKEVFAWDLEGDCLYLRLERAVTKNQAQVLNWLGLMNGNPRVVQVPSTATASLVNGFGFHLAIEGVGWTVHAPIAQQPKTESRIEIRGGEKEFNIGRIKPIRNVDDLKALARLRG